MKTLIVYDSKYGNTKRIAERIAAALGESATLTDCEHLQTDMLDGVDLLVLGTPTRNHTATPLARDAAVVIGESVSSRDLKVAAFDTGFVGPFAGSGAVKLAHLMREAGFEVVGEPEHFLVEHLHGPLAPGEAQRAEDWAHVIAA